MFLSLSSVKYRQEPMAEALLSLKDLESANPSHQSADKIKFHKTDPGTPPGADSGSRVGGRPPGCPWKHCGPGPTCLESVIGMEHLVLFLNLVSELFLC